MKNPRLDEVISRHFLARVACDKVAKIIEKSQRPVKFDNTGWLRSVVELVSSTFST